MFKNGFKSFDDENFLKMLLEKIDSKAFHISERDSSSNKQSAAKSE
jgi:hypothetical protein